MSFLKSAELTAANAADSAAAGDSNDTLLVRILNALLAAVTAAEGGGGGGIAGPEESTDDAVAVWDGVDGSALKNSTVTISSGVLTAGTLQTGALKVGTALAWAIFDASNVSGSDKTYLLPNANGTMALTSDITAAVTGLLDFKGATDCSANPNYPAASKGDFYVVSVTGKIGGASGVTVEAGDCFYALDDNAGGTQAGVGTSWSVAQGNVTFSANGLSLVTAANYAAMRTLLGLVVGTDVQAFSAILAAFVALSPSNDDFLQRKSGAWANRTVAQVRTDLQGDGLTTEAEGFRGVPQNSRSAAYTIAASDNGKHILHPSADTTARTFTIDSNANLALPVGFCVTFVNQHGAGDITIAITTDTMRLAGDGSTGSRTLAANGVATALKLTATEWIISGTGLT